MPPSPVALVDDTQEPPVRGTLHAATGASGDGIVLAHGAGGNQHAPLLVALATELALRGISALRCDLPFRQARPTGPPGPGSAARDRQGLAHALAALGTHARGRLFLGGHSYGGRQASMLAADHPELVSGLLLTSYPLHPPGRPTALRTEHFPRLRVPVLVVQGGRDTFGTPADLTPALALVPAPTRLVPIPSRGHDLVGKTAAAETARTIVEAFLALVSPRG